MDDQNKEQNSRKFQTSDTNESSPQNVDNNQHYNFFVPLEPEIGNNVNIHPNQENVEPSYFQPQKQQNQSFQRNNSPTKNIMSGISPPSIRFQKDTTTDRKSPELNFYKNYHTNLTNSDYTLPSPPNFSTYFVNTLSSPHIQSSPTFISTTTNYIPNSKELFSQFHLPFGLVVHPFSKFTQQKFPVVNMGKKIVRCGKCRAYVNPLFQFFCQGRKYKCNVCLHVNSTPSYYNVKEDENGIVSDVSSRIELMCGNIDFIAPPDYTPRTPQPSAHLFLIEVTSEALKSGQVEVICKTILKNLENFNGDDRTLVGFITFDECLHFYNLDGQLSKPKMLVVTELTSINEVIPYPKNLLVNLKDSKEIIVELLNSLPIMFKKNLEMKKNDSCLGAALNAAGLVLGRVGGSLLVFISNIPSIGPHCLKKRLNEEEKQLFLPKTTDFVKLGELYSHDQISANVIVISNSFVDISTILPMCKLTGGSVKLFPYFNRKEKEILLKNEIEQLLVDNLGFEAVLKIRLGPGISVKSFYGSFTLKKNRIIVFPMANIKSSVSCVFEPKNDFLISPIISFQSALLYTTPRGERRIRVNNLYIPVVNNLNEVYRNINSQTTICLLSKILAQNILKSGDVLKEKTEILKTFFNNFRGYSYKKNDNMYINPSNEVIVSGEMIKLFYYVFSLIKCTVFNSITPVDQKSVCLLKLINYGVEDCLLFLLPKVELISLEKQIQLLRLTKSRLSAQGIYFFHKDDRILLFIGYDHSKK